MDARHEFFHAPGDGEFWSESHYLDVIGDGAAAHARIGFYPNRDAANVFAYLLDGTGTDATVYRLRDDAVDLDHVHGLTVDAPDLHFEMVPEEVGRDWRVAFGGTATRCESAADVVGGDGEPVAVDVELVTRARHEPFLYSGGADWPGGEDEDRYEVATRVEGAATVEGEETRTLTLEGPGERDHSWGRRDWTDGEWLWISGSFEDGSAYNHLSAWPAGYGPSEMDPVITNGFWFDGETVHAVTAADLSADPPFGEETGSEWMEAGAAPTIDLTLEWDGGSTALAVEPGATTPVDWKDEDTGHRAVLNRSPSVQTRDGEIDGRGWLENMTQFPE
ncbi:hypothetical protein BRC89_12990 [Halobacteriales archaeon QS_4_70_19]|nr:MAG: hypothetical protein BRC89_12990 [Halobacteriales archaeon QS_4_70_19]